MTPLFTSARLQFREFTLEDSELIYDLNSDPEVTKYVHEAPTTKESAKSIIADNILLQCKQNNYGRWALHLLETEKFIGWCGLKYRPQSGIIDIGYRLKRDYWGLGYATEAAKATIRYAFSKLNLPQLHAFAHVDNIVSWKVLEKCGMQFLGFDEIDNTPVRAYKIANTIS